MDDSEVEIARHELRIEQLSNDLRHLSEDLAKEKEERQKDKKTIDDIMRMALVARVVFIGAVAVGGFGSWLLGVTDSLRRLVSSHTLP